MLETPLPSGLLLHPASLPGRFGMGEIGPEAHRWLQVMAECGQRLWFVPPLNATSSFAGDPLLLSFDSLRNDGVLLPEDLALLPAFDEHHVDPAPVSEVRAAFLRLAARRFLEQCQRSPLLGHAFEKFCDDEAEWLDDWSLHAALKDAHEQQPWHQWSRALAARDADALAEAMVQYVSEIEEHQALQFLYFRHWQRLRAVAHGLNVQLIGTLPFFIECDSVDAWLAPKSIALDAGFQPIRFAVINEELHLAYDWEENREQCIGWWRTRYRAMKRWFDEVAVDHSKAAEATWEVAHEGASGCWAHGPGDELLGGLSVIALDAAEPKHRIVSISALLDGRDVPGWRFTWDQLDETFVERLRELR